MNRYEACISRHWESAGLAQLIVTRFRDQGSADSAFFLVDCYCLGVKDAFAYFDAMAGDARDLLDRQLPAGSGGQIHPACAKKLIEGAVAYAESLGFAPHRDFRKARKILSGLDASLCPRDFVYGRDGRPCFVQGPDDSNERVDRVFAILTARFGPEGFDFEGPGWEEDDDDEADFRADLRDFLAAEDDDVPRFYEFSGLLTAMLICPTVLMPTQAFAALWGEAGRGWEGDEEMQYFTDLLMEYWNYLSLLVRDAIGPEAHPDEEVVDVWLEDFAEIEGGAETRGLPLAAASFAWAGGFRRAMQLWPEAWGDALTRPDLAPHWEVIGWWAGLDVKENREKMMAAAEAPEPRTLNSAVKALARALRGSSG